MRPSTASKPITTRPLSAAAALVLALLRGYKLLISQLFGGCCRYYPSCADYMRDAIEIHGAGRGVWLGLRRLCRCHPLGSHGVDPVPR
ncbi:MAG: membrane protein insertion efficiency factor YidD [Acidimicrobiia bacterium]|nr:membrane protein insertion efficiency factor YidD [Acidimicrobiia bacterium]